MNDAIGKALYRKAVGYTAKETVEEYAGEDGILSKRKVSKKHIPPDFNALKMLVERECKAQDYRAMSDEELAREKARLLEELRQTQKGEADENRTNKA